MSKEKEFLDAYFAWASLPSERYRDRQIAWEKYIAIRDGKENTEEQPQEEALALPSRRLIQ